MRSITSSGFPRCTLEISIRVTPSPPIDARTKPDVGRHCGTPPTIGWVAAKTGSEVRYLNGREPFMLVSRPPYRTTTKIGQLVPWLDAAPRAGTAKTPMQLH